MGSLFSQVQNVFESGKLTVTSGGHWFHATRKTVEEFVPGLLEVQEFDRLILDAVTWIESTDSLSLLLYFALVFLLPVETAVAVTVTVLFYAFWYFRKSAFVSLLATPLLKLLNLDVLQIGVAALALTFLGMGGNYSGLLFGILFFFLFKVGLLRLLLIRLGADHWRDSLPLNDRVLKMVLVRHSIREDLTPPEVEKLEESIREGVLTVKERISKK
ncbi:MAG: hypothetical protein WD315_01565 [Balneolaceae bacterium]